MPSHTPLGGGESNVQFQKVQQGSGGGAKYRYTKAKQAIQTISYWARSMMTHAALHLPGDGANNIQLWDFAVTHVAWLYNHLPNKNLGWISPLEIFTKTKSNYSDLLRTRVWGCPPYLCS